MKFWKNKMLKEIGFEVASGQQMSAQNARFLAWRRILKFAAPRHHLHTLRSGGPYGGFVPELRVFQYSTSFQLLVFHMHGLGYKMRFFLGGRGGRSLHQTRSRRRQDRIWDACAQHTLNTSRLSHPKLVIPVIGPYTSNPEARSYLIPVHGLNHVSVVCVRVPNHTLATP